MVQDVSPSRLMMLFTKGLMEPLKGWVKAFKLANLQDVYMENERSRPSSEI
jgi:hypothetical protein